MVYLLEGKHVTRRHIKGEGHETKRRKGNYVGVIKEKRKAVWEYKVKETELKERERYK